MALKEVVSLGRVFEASLSEDKKSVEFIEGCDYYYTKFLSKEEMEELIKDLTYLTSLIDDSWH